MTETTNVPGASRMSRRGPIVLAALAGAAVVAPHAWAATKSYDLSASGELQRTARPSALSTVQAGTLRGRPFGSGRMVLRSTLKRGTVTSTFTLDTSAGRVTGRATARLTIRDDTATYRGTATITGGTRRYRAVRGTNLRFTGVGPVSAKSARITLTGRVRY